MTKAKVWIDGAVVDAAQARISVLDHAFLYGDGVFEGIRVYSRRVFRLRDHMRRLATGARAIGLALPRSLSELEEIVCESARAFGKDDCYLRLILTRGMGPLGVDPTLCENGQVVCIASGIQLYPKEKLEAGIEMVTSSLRRPSADALDPRVKSLNYLSSVMAKGEARRRGADEALILNSAGLVAEASVANVFAVRDGVISTPPTTDGALEGITRASIIDIASAEGIGLREVSLGRFDLLAADEVFLTGSGARIVPVASLDGQGIGNPLILGTKAAVGAGSSARPITSQLSKVFSDYVLAHGTPI